MLSVPFSKIMPQKLCYYSTKIKFNPVNFAARHSVFFLILQVTTLCKLHTPRSERISHASFDVYIDTIATTSICSKIRRTAHIKSSNYFTDTLICLLLEHFIYFILFCSTSLHIYSYVQPNYLNLWPLRGLFHLLLWRGRERERERESEKSRIIYFPLSATSSASVVPNSEIRSVVKLLL
jgi:hypothetical protein